MLDCCLAEAALKFCQTSDQSRVYFCPHVKFYAERVFGEIFNEPFEAQITSLGNLAINYFRTNLQTK